MILPAPPVEVLVYVMRREDRTASEALFEQYLCDRCLSYECEPLLAGSTKRADYLVDLRKATHFEVKEFASRRNEPQVGSLDPCKRTRAKIVAARRQFKAFPNSPCVLVLSNPHAALVPLEPQFVFGAMLGDLGLSMPIDVVTGVADDRQVTNAFLTGGSMIRYHEQRAFAPSKTRISAVCVLSELQEGSRRVGIRIEEWIGAHGRRPSGTELAALLERLPQELNLPVRLRLLVHDNPFGKLPLPPDFPSGPYDERFGALPGGRIARTFVGPGLRELEAAEAIAGISRPDPLGLRFGHKAQKLG